MFRADEDGLTQFAQYLQSTPPDPVSLLVDVVEEEFREETVPHVMGTDRRALLRNKKTRLFRDATYSYAMLQGRESEGRRDDRVLFTALIRPDMLAPWLGQLARLKIPLTGIYSLPLLSEMLLKKLKVSGSHVLLVSMHSTGGLRQSFLQDQRLKLSRLAITPDVGQARYPSYILGEIEKLRRYLGSLRLLSRETPLEVPCDQRRGHPGGAGSSGLGLDNDTSSFSQYRRSCQEDRAQKSHRAGSHRDGVRASAGKETVKNHYAPQRETRYFSMQRARTGMVAASWLLLLAGISFAGVKFIEIVNTTQESLIIKEKPFFIQSVCVLRERVCHRRRRWPTKFNWRSRWPIPCVTIAHLQ